MHKYIPPFSIVPMLTFYKIENEIRTSSIARVKINDNRVLKIINIIAMVIAGYSLENIVILIDNNTWVSCVFSFA